MLDVLYNLWGTHDTNLTIVQMSLRALVTFIAAIALVRIAGRRSFGMKSPFDNTFAILIGAILAQGVIGRVPFDSGLVACTLLAVAHRFFAFLSIKYSGFGAWIKGSKILLYSNGKLDEKNMVRSLISENDLMERIRLGGFNSLDQIEEAYMERNGEVSVVPKMRKI
jgi:uncharacterized membrane protein YcaP (DUF421 family)